MKAMVRGFLPTPHLQEYAGTDEFRDKYGKHRRIMQDLRC
jgi:hypothetical protein